VLITEVPRSSTCLPIILHNYLKRIACKHVALSSHVWRHAAEFEKTRIKNGGSSAWVSTCSIIIPRVTSRCHTSGAKCVKLTSTVTEKISIWHIFVQCIFNVSHVLFKEEKWKRIWRTSRRRQRCDDNALIGINGIGFVATRHFCEIR
jgi:hypothetical protein